MAGGKGSAKKVSLTHRRMLAMELRKAGLSYREIASTLKKRPGISDKYNESQAHKDVKYGLERTVELTRQAAQEVRRLELERLNDLHRVLWGQVVVAEAEGRAPDLRAVDRLLRVQERRARLRGLDEPLRLTIDDIEAYARRVAEVIGREVADSDVRRRIFESLGFGDSVA